MIGFLTTMFGTLFFGGIIIISAMHNVPQVILGMIGGCFLTALLFKGYNVHPHKYERDQLRNEYRDNLREYLCDNIAFMCAIHDNVHSSYQPFVVNDANQMFVRANKEHLHLDQSYIEMLYYNYLLDPSIGFFAQAASSEYDKLP